MPPRCSDVYIGRLYAYQGPVSLYKPLIYEFISNASEEKKKFPTEIFAHIIGRKINKKVTHIDKSSNKILIMLRYGEKKFSKQQ